MVAAKARAAEVGWRVQMLAAAEEAVKDRAAQRVVGFWVVGCLVAVLWAAASEVATAVAVVAVQLVAVAHWRGKRSLGRIGRRPLRLRAWRASTMQLVDQM